MRYPTANVKVYGYVVLVKRNGEWTAEKDEDYLNLPAHYELFDEANDRVQFLIEKGVTARVTALLALPEDSPKTLGEK